MDREPPMMYRPKPTLLPLFLISFVKKPLFLSITGNKIKKIEGLDKLESLQIIDLAPLDGP